MTAQEMREDYERRARLFREVLAQDNHTGTNDPHGWIQWKVTRVCADLYCSCGYHGHFDGGFFYHYSCPKCGQKYAVGQNVKLIALTDEQAAQVETGGVGFKTSALDDEDYDWRQDVPLPAPPPEGE